MWKPHIPIQTTPFESCVTDLYQILLQNCSVVSSVQRRKRRKMKMRMRTMPQVFFVKSLFYLCNSVLDTQKHEIVKQYRDLYNPPQLFIHISHILISENLSVLSGKTVISRITGNHKKFFVLFHWIIKVHRCSRAQKGNAKFKE